MTFWLTTGKVPCSYGWEHVDQNFAWVKSEVVRRARIVAGSVSCSLAFWLGPEASDVASNQLWSWWFLNTALLPEPTRLLFHPGVCLPNNFSQPRCHQTQWPGGPIQSNPLATIFDGKVMSAVACLLLMSSNTWDTSKTDCAGWRQFFGSWCAGKWNQDWLSMSRNAKPQIGGHNCRTTWFGNRATVT